MNTHKYELGCAPNQKSTKRRMTTDCNYSVLCTLLMNFLKIKGMYKPAQDLAKKQHIPGQKNYSIIVLRLSYFYFSRTCKFEPHQSQPQLQHKHQYKIQCKQTISQLFQWLQRELQNCVLQKYTTNTQQFRKLTLKRNKQLLTVFRRVFQQSNDFGNQTAIRDVIIEIYNDKKKGFKNYSKTHYKNAQELAKLIGKIWMQFWNKNTKSRNKSAVLSGNRQSGLGSSSELEKSTERQNNLQDKAKNIPNNNNNNNNYNHDNISNSMDILSLSEYFQNKTFQVVSSQPTTPKHSHNNHDHMLGHGHQQLQYQCENQNINNNSHDQHHNGDQQHQHHEQYHGYYQKQQEYQNEDYQNMQLNLNLNLNLELELQSLCDPNQFISYSNLDLNMKQDNQNNHLNLVDLNSSDFQWKWQQLQIFQEIGELSEIVRANGRRSSNELGLEELEEDLRLQLQLGLELQLEYQGNLNKFQSKRSRTNL